MKKKNLPDLPESVASSRRMMLAAMGAVTGAAMGLSGCTSLGISPRPTTALIKLGFDKMGESVNAALAKHVPEGVEEIRDERYAPDDEDALLDVYLPANDASGGAASRALPAIVWIHGGAWVSGDKAQIANYLKLLASKGYTVVGVNYSIAPKKIYPAPLEQVSAALRHLQVHAARLRVDPDKFFLAGDSAGAQIAAQLANIISVPAYAREVGVQAPLRRAQLRGVLLYCGAYDMALVDFDGVFGPFLKSVLWSYAGEKDFANDPRFAAASVARYVTPAFPPTFISAGNADPLEPQSRAMVDALSARKVRVDSLFYPRAHRPRLNHEYQFDLDGEAGQLALARSLRFLARHA